MTTSQYSVQQFEKILEKKIGIHKMLDLLEPIIDDLSTMEQSPDIDNVFEIYDQLDILSTHFVTAINDMTVNNYWSVQSDLVKCHKKLNGYPIASTLATFSKQLSEHFKDIDTTHLSTEQIPPNCPKCGSPMVQRVNSNTGQEFYGCSQFPECRCTRPFY